MRWRAAGSVRWLYRPWRRPGAHGADREEQQAGGGGGVADDDYGHVFAVGDLVSWKSCHDSRVHRGIVIKVKDNESLEVEFEDGTHQEQVTWDKLQLVPPKPQASRGGTMHGARE